VEIRVNAFSVTGVMTTSEAAVQCTCAWRFSFTQNTTGDTMIKPILSYMV
jgi:hypothetical protein